MQEARYEGSVAEAISSSSKRLFFIVQRKQD